MTDAELFERVRLLRGDGRTPKDIARALGVRPAAVIPIVRRLAADAAPEAHEPVEAPLVGCWLNQGWSDELVVNGHPEWPRGGSSPSVAGLATAVVAREAKGGRVSVCTILVDTMCLGVKDAMPPRKVREEELRSFVRFLYGAYDLPPIEAPLELVQHLVFGAVDYAASLGFRPHRDLASCGGHLGTWTGPSAITFGREGKPMYVAGPRDDVRQVMKTLERSVGQGNFDFVVAASAFAMGV